MPSRGKIHPEDRSDMRLGISALLFAAVVVVALQVVAHGFSPFLTALAVAFLAMALVLYGILREDRLPRPVVHRLGTWMDGDERRGWHCTCGAGGTGQDGLAEHSTQVKVQRVRHESEFHARYGPDDKTRMD